MTLKYYYIITAESEISFFSNLSGVKDDVGSKSIDEMNPSTKEEFVELSQLIVGKLSNYEVMIVLCEVRPCLITLRRELKTHYF